MKRIGTALPFKQTAIASNRAKTSSLPSKCFCSILAIELISLTFSADHLGEDSKSWMHWLKKLLTTDGHSVQKDVHIQEKIDFRF